MGINNIRGKNFTIEGLYCDRWTNKKGKCDIFLESWILNNKIPDKTLAGYKDSIIVSFTIPKHWYKDTTMIKTSEKPIVMHYLI